MLYIQRESAHACDRVRRKSETACASPVPMADGDAGPAEEPHTELTLVQQLTQKLAANLSKVIDLFRDWDDDGDGQCVQQRASKCPGHRCLCLLSALPRSRGAAHPDSDDLDLLPSCVQGVKAGISPCSSDAWLES